jgi:hypothetical protein
MFRLGPLATLSALILTGCVSTYAYREGDGGDYYYSEPRVEYYDVYGRPWGSIGYGYPGSWYGSFGYLYGPYSRHGYRVYPGDFGWYGGFYPPYGYPAYWYHPHGHRPPHPWPPTVPGTTPGPGGSTPGNRPIGLRDREGGPWRHLDEIGRRRMALPQPAEPGATGEPPRTERPRRPPVPMSQPGVEVGGGERVRRPPAMPSQPAEPRPRSEAPRPAFPPAGRIEGRERESRRDPEP